MSKHSPFSDLDGTYVYYATPFFMKEIGGINAACISFGSGRDLTSSSVVNFSIFFVGLRNPLDTGCTTVSLRTLMDRCSVTCITPCHFSIGQNSEDSTRLSRIDLGQRGNDDASVPSNGSPDCNASVTLDVLLSTVRHSCERIHGYGASYVIPFRV